MGRLHASHLLLERVALPAAPVVPKSLVQPVPASQARSAIQELLDANRARVERLSRAGQRQLVQQLVALEAELRERLAGLQRAGRSDTWTAADTEATLVQVRELLGRQGERFKAMLAENAATARRLGVKNTVGVLQHFEGKRGGPIRPLSLESSEAALAPLLARYEASVARYGAHTLSLVARALQRGQMVGDTFAEMTRRLTGERGDHGPLVRSAGWASRIVRTEGLHALNAGAYEEALAQRAHRFNDLKKRLIETFDARTGADSRAAHGEVRDLEGLFVDGKGRHYLHPPGRPHDRGVCIPWREAWKSDPLVPVRSQVRRGGEDVGLPRQQRAEPIERWHVPSVEEERTRQRRAEARQPANVVGANVPRQVSGEGVDRLVPLRSLLEEPRDPIGHGLFELTPRHLAVLDAERMPEQRRHLRALLATSDAPAFIHPAPRLPVPACAARASPAPRRCGGRCVALPRRCRPAARRRGAPAAPETPRPLPRRRPRCLPLPRAQDGTMVTPLPPCSYPVATL